MGNLTVTQGNAGNFAGRVWGTGNFVKAGSATLTLSGASNFGGSTSINAGAITLGANMNFYKSFTMADTSGVGINIGSYNLYVTNLSGGGSSGGNFIGSGGTVYINQKVNGTFSGAWNSSGTVIKSGDGTLATDGDDIDNGTHNFSDL